MAMRRRIDGLAAGIAFSAVLLAAAAAAAQQPKDLAEMGLGANSCARFSEMYGNDPASTETTFFTWAQGFMSAINLVLLGREHQRSTNLALWDVERQKRHILSYCAANPSRAYDEGVFDLFEAMRKEQGLPSLAR
ncbi:MAG TPA: hypothetical protein VEI03_10075 [Stellaceae bacterium]|nr:hypothetical protein [Stellaceae bacterium]